MAWAASLSTNTPTESSGYRVPVEPDLSRVPESGNPQPADEYWTAGRRTADWRATAWWSAYWGSNH